MFFRSWQTSITKISKVTYKFTQPPTTQKPFESHPTHNSDSQHSSANFNEFCNHLLTESLHSSHSQTQACKITTNETPYSSVGFVFQLTLANFQPSVIREENHNSVKFSSFKKQLYPFLSNSLKLLIGRSEVLISTRLDLRNLDFFLEPSWRDQLLS